MIPSQISYTPSQGAYYIPGQVRVMLWTLWEGIGIGTGGGVAWTWIPGLFWEGGRGTETLSIH